MKSVPVIFCPTGMVPTKESNPNVPLSPKEIALDVKRACEIGITAVHLHARDSIGTPTFKSDVYKEIIYQIKSFNSELIINVSTSGRNWSELEKRSECLLIDSDLKPDMASLTTSSLNFITQASVNSPNIIRSLASIMKNLDIIPELEIFDLGMINFAKVLQKEKLLPNRLFINLFFGNIFSAQATDREMDLLIELCPPNSIINLAGLGSYRKKVISYAVKKELGIRTGLEDSLYMDSNKKFLATNELLIEDAHNLINSSNLKVMRPTELRILLNKSWED